jgi:HSP20 family molecular chaperone IbpA
VEAIRPQPVRTSATVHRLEIPYGRFERRIPLPSGRYELVEQSYANGCLTLRLVRLNREAV